MSRLYRLLLLLYPPDFRNKYGKEQANVFDDMWQQRRRDGNFFSAGLFAIVAMIDLLFTALLTGDRKPGVAEKISTLMGLLLLLPASIFATVNITKYYLREPALYDWWSSTGIHFSDLVILAGPLAAMVVLLAPLVRFSAGNGTILQRSSQKLSSLSIAIAAGSVLIMGIFTMYGIAENILPML